MLMAHKMLLLWTLVCSCCSLKYVTCLQHNTIISSVQPMTPQPPRTEVSASPTSLTPLQTTVTTTITPTAQATSQAPTSNIPSIIITLTFTISWKEFCPLKEKFRKKLASHLIEQNKDKVIQIISAERIRYINVDIHCTREDSYGDVKAVVELYVSKRDELDKVDEALTTKAYRILDNYVINNKMSKIDTVFTNKVNYVRISGEKAPKQRKGTLLTEFDKVAIGVGVSLIVVAVCVLIYRRRKASIRKSTSRQPTNQPNASSSQELEMLRPTEDT